jgi:hypothetical protein
VNFLHINRIAYTPERKIVTDSVVEQRAVLLDKRDVLP